LAYKLPKLKILVADIITIETLPECETGGERQAGEGLKSYL